MDVAMDRDAVIARLRAHEAELRAAGIARVYLFGSVARGEADEKCRARLILSVRRYLG